MICSENYKIVGCSTYCYTNNLKLYFFWLTSLDSGTTKMLFVDRTRFIKFTLLDEDKFSDHDEISLKCVSCDNMKCMRHKLVKNDNHNFVFSFEYFDDYFLPKEHKSPQCNTLFFGCIFNGKNDISTVQKIPVLIAEISKQGLICKILPADYDNEFSVDDTVELAICSRNFLNKQKCTECTDELTKERLGILEGSISWKIDNYIGIYFHNDTEISGLIDFITSLV